MRVLSVGEILWDIFPDQECLGGAALNFSANISRLGNLVTLVTAVGDDVRGQAAIETMRQMGLTTETVQLVRDRATGVAQVSMNRSGDPTFEILRPAAFDSVAITSELRANTLTDRPDWLYFGTLIQTEPSVEEMIRHLAQNLPGIRCFYDINLRDDQWNIPLVERLCRLASVLKMNEMEAQTLAHAYGLSSHELLHDEFCRVWAETFEIDAICITLGAGGCYVYFQNAGYNFPGYSVAVADTVGAGDAFAAAFLHGFHHRWPIELIARFANALGSVVASKAGATPIWTIDECLATASLSFNDVASSSFN